MKNQMEGGNKKATPFDMAPVLTLQEVSAKLRVDDKTVRRLIESGELSASRVGRVIRVRQEDFDEFLRLSKEKVANLPPKKY